MVVTASRERALEYFERNPLQNIPALKVLELYPTQTSAFFADIEGESGALVFHSPSVTSYDRKTYRDCSAVAMLSADGPKATHTLLSQLPSLPVLFKIGGNLEKSLLDKQFELEQVQHFYSYTIETPIPEAVGFKIELFDQPREAAIKLWMAQHHSRQEIHQRFKSGSAFGVSVDIEDQTAASCYVFQIHPQILEIGGLYTLPEFRGRGLGDALVRRAINEILGRGKKPRYHVHSSNTASIRLAERVGLRRFFTLEHLLATQRK